MSTKHVELHGLELAFGAFGDFSQGRESRELVLQVAALKEFEDWLDARKQLNSCRCVRSKLFDRACQGLVHARGFVEAKQLADRHACPLFEHLRPVGFHAREIVEDARDLVPASGGTQSGPDTSGCH